MPIAARLLNAVHWTGGTNLAGQLPRYFERLYQSVVSGEETRVVLEANSAPDYKEKLEAN